MSNKQEYTAYSEKGHLVQRWETIKGTCVYKDRDDGLMVILVHLRGDPEPYYVPSVEYGLNQIGFDTLDA